MGGREALEMSKRSNLIPMLMLVAILVGVALFLATFLRPKTFTSLSTIRIVAKNPAIVVGSVPTGQRQLIGSEAIAIAASQTERVKQRLAGGGFIAFPNAKEPKDLVQPLMYGLRLSHLSNRPNDLVLSYRCLDRDEAKLLLESILEAYDDALRDVDQDGNGGYKVLGLERPCKGIPRSWWPLFGN